jgi:hypothetical protein
VAPPPAERPPLGHFRFIADHEAERFPAAPRQRPAPQRRRLEAHQQRDQKAGEKFHRRRHAGDKQQNAESKIHNEIADEYQP